MGGWSRIQSASAISFSTAVSATFSTANLSAGCKVIAAVGSSWNDAPSSVKDGAGNSWTQLGSEIKSGGCSVWLYALDVPSGDVGTKPTITATFPSSNGQSIVIQEVSGLLAGNTTAMLDGTPAGLSGTAASTGSPSYSSTAAGEYLLCIFADGNVAATIVAGGSLTLDPNNTTSQSHTAIEYGDSMGGAETTGFTSAPSSWTILTAAFKLAAAPVSPSGQLMATYI